MYLSTHFISASHEYNTYAKHVPAPLIRKSFNLESVPDSAEITLTGLGFYELYVNGKNITKGLLAPYISNPDDVVYYDNYEVSEFLKAGENIIGIILGNGMQNASGGFVWDFDIAAFRGAPRLALCFEAGDFKFEADESFLAAPSAITFDDLRSGCFYDARLEKDGWNLPGFDDSAWKSCVPAESARGEKKICTAEPILVSREIEPLSVTSGKCAPYKFTRSFSLTPQYKPSDTEGYIYDFGVNAAGICRLTVRNAVKGQVVVLQHGECLDSEGRLHYSNINFYPDGYSQRDIYICKGGAEEIFEPKFTYHGFRYCYVEGLTPEQATPEALTYLVANSALEERGSFECSDEVANKIQAMTRVSDLANFWYFPTDCPHREKNGWTGDASVSSEHILLNLGAEASYAEWLCNIRKAQAENGALPGIIPTGGWGFKWGNGPTWDSVLTILPYFTYKYRGDKTIIKENALAIMKYLNYICTQINDDGLIAIGLGDWLPPGRRADHYKVPLEFTDTVLVMSVCDKAAYMFGEIGMELQKQFALSLYARLREVVRERLVDTSRCIISGNSQTGQAMGIYFDIFEGGEKQKAFKALLDLIHANDDKLDVGFLGLRTMFHVLSEFGESDLAYKMITRPDYPSYGHFVANGLTALPEDFRRKDEKPASLNHHFFGDVSNWFISRVAGIQVNPHRTSPLEVNIAPAFVTALSFAKAHHDLPAGRVSCEWKREGGKIRLDIEIPEGVHGRITLPGDFVFTDNERADINGTSYIKLNSGTYYALPFEESIK